MTDHADTFGGLTLLVSEGDKLLREDVVLSVKDPDAYVNKYSKDLNRRGISKPVDWLPWIALIDGLEKKEKLIELDWKEKSEMFVNAVNKLLAKVGDSEQIHKQLSSIKFGARKTVPDILSRINLVLQKYDYTVIMVDIYSDCYPITLVRLRSYPAIKRKADLIEKDRIHHFFYSA